MQEFNFVAMSLQQKVEKPIEATEWRKNRP